MSAGEALSAHVSASEDSPGVLAPLCLGDPEEPALTLRDDLSRGHVVVETAWRTVNIGPLGVTAMRHWLERCQEKPSGGEVDGQAGNRSKSGLELWTASGIAKETGTPLRTVRLWVNRDDFPRPFAEPVGGGRIWEADVIRSWIATSRPKMGRPRSS